MEQQIRHHARAVLVELGVFGVQIGAHLLQGAAHSLSIILELESRARKVRAGRTLLPPALVGCLSSQLSSHSSQNSTTILEHGVGQELSMVRAVPTDMYWVTAADILTTLAQPRIPMVSAPLPAFYLLVVLHAFQLTLLANAEIQEVLPLILQGFLVSLWWHRM